MRSFHIPLLAILAAVVTIRTATPLTTTMVVGHSMEPTLRPGELYVLDRGYYRTHPLIRGDVVVLRHNGETLIKRVCGLPGDRLRLVRYMDGSGCDLLSSVVADQLRRSQSVGRLIDARMFSLTVPPGHCFVVGDNTQVSYDSREFGPVPISDIIGRAIL
jgi:signal peptidase I